jgi:hypothetical protein
VPNANDQSELILYQAEDGITRIHVRLVDGSVWLTQRQLGDLYQVSVPTVSEHLHNIFAEGELSLEATVRKFRTVRTGGNRTISRTVDHYSLPVVLAVGYRVRSPRGTQFRRWATTRLEEYIVKGFTLDDERLKQPAGPPSCRSSLGPARCRTRRRSIGPKANTWRSPSDAASKPKPRGGALHRRPRRHTEAPGG